MNDISSNATSVADISLAPLVRTEYGQLGPWLMALYQLYSEVDTAISLSTFVSRLLIPALEETQRQPSDYSLISTLRATPISDLGMIDLNEFILPNLLLELRLNVTIWIPIDLAWCTPDGLDPHTAQFHLQLDHGTIKRVKLTVHYRMQFDCPCSKQPQPPGKSPIAV